MLELKNIYKYFDTSNSLIKAVDGVDLCVKENQVVGLVGESGSGKSTLGKIVVGLHSPTRGAVYWQGKQLPNTFSRKDYIGLSKDIQMIFQNPYSSLNPRMQVQQILEEPLLLNKNKNYLKKSQKDRESFLKSQLELVGLRPEFSSRYPHEFSGGQLQRIGIARALIQMPKLLVCDEPISALDVSIQAQVVNLLRKLQQEFHLSMLFIAHDLAMVNYLCDEVAVMHKGKLVETGSREQIFFEPKHAYTQLLLSSNPVLNLK